MRMQEDYLIKEKPWKALLIFAFPLFIGNFFQQGYTVFDQILVGHYVGESAQAALGNASTFIHLFICIAIGGSVGASILISQYFGAKQFSKMKIAMYTFLLSFLLLSVLFGVLGFFFAKDFLILLKVPLEAIKEATDYVRIYFLGLPFVFLYQILSSFMNALGKSRIPLYFLLFSSLFNIGLDFLFMAYFKWGIKGAAWATFLAQGISLLLIGITFFHLLHHYPKTKIRCDMKEEKRLLKLAFPSILQQSAIAIGSLCVQSVVNSFDVSIVAGVSIAMRIESICIVPFSALGTALSSYAAQNRGALQIRRIWDGWKFALLYCLVCALLLGIILEVGNRNLVMIFCKETTSLAFDIGVKYIRWIGWFFFLLGFKMATDGVLRGLGKMGIFTLSNLSNLTIRILFTILLAPNKGIDIVWLVVPLGWFINDILSFLALWKQMKKRTLF